WVADAAYRNGAAGAGMNTTLMFGGLETQDTTYTGDNGITITGIPYAQYDLYLYVKGWSAGRTGFAQLQGVGGSEIGFNTVMDFPGSHSRATSTATVGTYVLWEDLTAGSVTIESRRVSNNIILSAHQPVANQRSERRKSSSRPRASKPARRQGAVSRFLAWNACQDESIRATDDSVIFNKGKFMICQSCGVEAPTKYVAFYQNIGLLVMRFSSSTEGDLCKSCVHESFWKHTPITLILGWWGILSFFLNCFFVLNNVFRYLLCLGMDPVPPGAMTPELSEAVAEKINPHFEGMVDRLNGGDDFQTVVEATAMRAGVTPGQVVLFLHAVAAAAEQEGH
ncbi:MAG: hypothetical protein N2C14_11660, partial [Planctomycetales bacterium]